MSAPDIIHELVNRFRDSYDFYTSANYNEAQLRQEFINPFFEALGWDMTNKAGYAPQYREVIHEDSQKQSDGKTKAPDYAFRIGPSRIFFLEAKKPHTKIKIESDPAFQLRRYGWNAHMSLSILTNFDKFAVYDCRTRPNEKDSPATGRVLFFSFEDYLEKWDEIASIFSKEAVLKGTYDRFAEDKKGKKGTTEVDSEFLKEIEKWRDKLARNIANRNFSRASNNQITNHHQAERNLNYAVQTTIDRILFLRICEDRKIEPENQLFEIANGKDIYANLLILFQKADQKYNSGLFHFSTEKDQTSEPDSFTPSLIIDDSVLRKIIKNTYYPCPYIFNEIPVEILGQVYEQFLGSVIRLTPSGIAKVEEKPEVRKAGGVYYTPRYIVDYIVQNTIGKLLNPASQSPSKEAGNGPKALSPEQALKIRIVDPACGSGSFLLGAYQFLLDYHLSYYLNHEPKNYLKGKSPALVPTDDGGYSLSLEAKKRILTSCIFGVDTDNQAVEVTKLSLLLKLLEGEKGQLSLGIERILPDLGNNIRCGNSLIGWDFFQDQLFADEEEIYRVNPFNWQAAFPQVFADGGFDAVIGNPPYIDSVWLAKTNPDFRDYCNLLFQSAKGNWDIYCVFIEKGLRVAKSNGFVSMIVPNKVISASYAAATRNIMIQNNRLINWRDYSSAKVFPVSVYPIVFVTKKQKPVTTDEILYEKVESVTLQDIDVSNSKIIKYEQLLEADPSKFSMHFSIGNSQLLDKIIAGSSPLDTIAKISGSATVSEAYNIVGLIRETGYEKNISFKFVNTGTIDRYVSLWDKKETRYLSNKYLKPFILKSELTDLLPVRASQASIEKIIIGGMNKRLECLYDEGEILGGKSTSIIFASKVNPFYLLGILNSKLMSYFYKTYFNGLKLEGDFYRIGPPQLKHLPIKIVNKNAQDFTKLTNLVQQMIKTTSENPNNSAPDRKRTDFISFLDSEIDKTVYSIYEIEGEDRAIIESIVT